MAKDSTATAEQKKLARLAELRRIRSSQTTGALDAYLDGLDKDNYAYCWGISDITHPTSVYKLKALGYEYAKGADIQAPVAVAGETMGVSSGSVSKIGAKNEDGSELVLMRISKEERAMIEQIEEEKRVSLRPKKDPVTGDNVYEVNMRV